MPQQSQGEKKKNKKPGGITFPDLRQYYKAIAIKTTWFWHKKTDIWINGMEQSPKINPIPMDN